MAYLLSGERPAAAAMPVSPSNLIAVWFANIRAARTRKQALARLLDLNDARLRDLGISRHDVLVAARQPQRSLGQVLNAARSRAAAR